MSSVLTKKLTYEDYVRLTPLDSGNSQLIDGEIVIMTSPSPRHQKTIRLLAKLLEIFFEKYHPLGELFFAPMDVQLENSEVYQPDLLFILEDRKHIIGETKINGAPDLVVEVLSLSNAYYDLITKKKVYENCGVKEYWIVDPIQNTLDLYVLENSKFILRQHLEQKGKLDSLLFPKLDLEIEKIFVH